MEIIHRESLWQEFLKQSTSAVTNSHWTFAIKPFIFWILHLCLLHAINRWILLRHWKILVEQKWNSVKLFRHSVFCLFQFLLPIRVGHTNCEISTHIYSWSAQRNISNLNEQKTAVTFFGKIIKVTLVKTITRFNNREMHKQAETELKQETMFTVCWCLHFFLSNKTSNQSLK